MDVCESYETIPQFSHTCWFNGILHVMLYSNLLRKFLYNHMKSIYPNKHDNDLFFVFIYYMLHNYNRIERLQKIYDEFKNVKLKSDSILLSYLFKYDKASYEMLRRKLQDNVLDFTNHNNYIYHIFKTYKINYIDLTSYNGELYLQSANRVYMEVKEKETEKYIKTKIENADILCINHNIDKFYTPLPTENLNKYKLSINDYDSFVTSVNKYSKILIINDIEYVLDCCLLVNFGTPQHVISCVTCNKKYYVYDSYDEYQSIQDFSNKKKINRIACKPYNYDWTNIQNSFYLNVNTCHGIYGDISLPVVEGYGVYNISISSVVLIYVKTSVKSNTMIKSKSISSLNVDRKLYINELKKLYDIENLPMNKLANHIRQIYGNDIVELSRNMNKNYKLLYEKMVKRILEPEISNETLRKELFIALINRFIKNATIFKHEKLVDDVYFENIKIKIVLPIFVSLSKAEAIKKSFELLGFENDVKIQNYIKLNTPSIVEVLYRSYKYKRGYDEYIYNLITSTIGDSPENKFCYIILKLYVERNVFKRTPYSIINDIFENYHKINYNFIKIGGNRSKQMKKYLKLK